MKVDIANDCEWSASGRIWDIEGVDADVQHSSSRFHPLVSDKLRVANHHGENIRVPRYGLHTFECIVIVVAEGFRHATERHR